MDSSAARQPARVGRKPYAVPFADKLAANPIGAAIEWLLPPRIRRQELIDLFEGRAHYEAIRAWRNAHCACPRWARDILDRRITERLAPGARLCEALRSAPAPRGQGWNKGARTLAAWRAREAAKREAATIETIGAVSLPQAPANQD